MAAHAGRAVAAAVSMNSNLLKCIRNDGSIFEHHLNPLGRLFIVGAGKATASMALAAEKIFGDRIFSGIISVKYGHTENLKFIRQIEASHPVPDLNGEKASQAILECVQSANENDCIIVLLSGGASALLPLPAEGITLDEKQKTTQILLSCGASIHEINCVRKHLSAIKGGLLAKAAYPAQIISLCVSDVIGDDLSVIGSGPCAPDPSTFDDAISVLIKYDIENKIPGKVFSRIKQGAIGNIAETPKMRDICFSRTENIIVMSNAIAMNEAENTATSIGYDVVRLSSSIEGDTTDAAKYHADIVRDIIARRNTLIKPVAVISGGETTVKVQGKGLGGRNMEFVLRCALELENELGIFIASAGTDGTDGPTDAAGAWIATEKIRSMRQQGIIPEQFANNNDSYNFFREAETLIHTGPTGTNVLDIRIILLYPVNET